MSEQTTPAPTPVPEPTFHEDWDKNFTDAESKVRAALEVMQQTIPGSAALQAGLEGLATMKEEYRYKVVVQLRPERDGLKAKLALYDETINKLTRDVGDRDMKLGEYQRSEIVADELQGKLKKAMTNKGIKLP